MNYAIIQARMNSSRLPGKVLMDLCGRPVLAHIINRVQAADSIDKIIVATSTNPENNAIEKLSMQLDVSCFRGSEDDVLARFKGAIKEYGIQDDDNVVRICCDCPLVDPSIIDAMLDYHINYNCGNEFTSNCIERTFPDGLDVEIFRASVFNSPDFHRFNPFEIDYDLRSFDDTKFKVFSIRQENNLSHLRWTLDTQADYEHIKKIYEALYQEGEIFYMEDVLKWLQN